MVYSDVRAFTEPGEFAAAMRGADVEVCLLEPGPFSANLTRIDLNSITIHRGSETQARVMHAAINHDRAVFWFRTEPGADLFRSGIELPPDSIARLGRSQSSFQRSTGPISWGDISLAVDAIPLAGTTSAGCDLMPPQAETIVPVAPAAMAKLLRLHAAAGLLAETSPEMIEQPEIKRSMEQALLESLVECLGTGDGTEDRPKQRRRKKIMAKFYKLLDVDRESPLYVLEIARMLNVSERSLSDCCREYLGIGPKKYLLLRRMHLARQALFKAEPRRTTVTDIATQYGFWQLGRFAVEYKSLFGESPSMTLHSKMP